jgi:threonine/homoserine/homoserine lactone efflux protein
MEVWPVITLGVLFGVLFYFLPTLIAMKRNAEHSNAIFAVDVLLGWTVLGWLAALLWAVTDKERAKTVSNAG